MPQNVLNSTKVSKGKKCIQIIAIGIQLPEEHPRENNNLLQMIFCNFLGEGTLKFLTITDLTFITNICGKKHRYITNEAKRG